MVIEGSSIALLTQSNNTAAFMERLITPEIGDVPTNTSRMIYFELIQYANYQIRPYRKNVFKVSSNYIMFSTTVILYTNMNIFPMKTAYNMTTSPYSGY